MKRALQEQRREHNRRIKILYFAQLRDLIGGRLCEEVHIPDGTSVQDLLSMIAKNNPGINPLMRSISVSINCRIVSRDRLLNSGDEVALLPPIAGG
jgi:molybdopterin converting factor small subunit